MKIDWLNAGTSAGFQTSQLQITLQNGESSDDGRSPAVAGNTGDGDDHDLLAEIYFGIISIDTIIASSSEVVPPWISFTRGANYCTHN